MDSIIKEGHNDTSFHSFFSFTAPIHQIPFWSSHPGGVQFGPRLRPRRPAPARTFQTVTSSGRKNSVGSYLSSFMIRAFFMIPASSRLAIKQPIKRNVQAGLKEIFDFHFLSHSCGASPPVYLQPDGRQSCSHN